LLKTGQANADSQGVRGPPPRDVQEPAPAAAPPVAQLGSVLGPQERIPLGEALVDRGLLSDEGLRRALEHQARTGGRLGQILVATGMVRRHDLYLVLSEQWGLPFADLTTARIDLELIERVDPSRLLALGMFPMSLDDDGLTVAVVEPPSDETARHARHLVGVDDDTIVTLMATTGWDLDWAVRECFAERLESEAKWHLARTNAGASAHIVLTRGQKLALLISALVTVGAAVLVPDWTFLVAILAVNLLFTAGILFKFVVSLAGVRNSYEIEISDDDVADLTDVELPTYSILVPVYKEANIVGLLMENLAGLDYPEDKLEILLLMEDDDQATIDAARAARPPETVHFIVIPDGQPKTKPKACNVGLRFARGEFLVIYDAEDRPEPDQLKKAVIAFRRGGERLACVQGALNYFNTNENFLTRMFTLEYSFWFDYMLRGLVTLRLPIPLGGTSNHFRTSVLRDLGGWDPFNVTEDADLGIRASALGYTVGVINSTTYEEANTATRNWIRQRSRWIKGYMQTALVHSRNPGHLVRVTGWRGASGFALLIAGTPITFLMAPLLWLIAGVMLFSTAAGLDAFPAPIVALGLFNLIFGNTVAVYLSMLAVYRRHQYGLIWWALLTPVYWVLHSIAAYKALWQLIFNPFYWEKTEHGLTQVSAPESHDRATRETVPTGAAT
jgi:cellulose synthase/poly-beta-1,6-N-acetylglucosamine synthase-like glycosyltransferase